MCQSIIPVSSYYLVSFIPILTLPPFPNLKAYLAERHIETELRNVERLLISNATQTEQWASVLNRLSTELKELGDITNWLDILEKAAVEIRQLSRKV